MRQRDDERLDAIEDLSRLSDRQLLERLVRSQERLAFSQQLMEIQMANDTQYIEAALSSLDVQLSDLGTRTQNMADQLRQAANDASDLADLRNRVNGYADKIQADAVAVLNMAQPSQVANPSTPDTTTPVPTDPAQPIPTDSGNAPADVPPADQPAPADASTDGSAVDPVDGSTTV